MCSDVARQQIVIVLGMHRSGTSAITRGLQALGVQLGNNLIPAIEDNNPKGFWEDRDFLIFNEELQRKIHTDWHYLAGIEPGDVDALRRDGCFLRAVELLRGKVADAAAYGLKDPRIARLLPFWDKVIAHCGYDVRYVFAVRHPLSVVKSLAKRDGFEPEKSYLLWVGHVLESLADTAGAQRVVVDFDRLMQSPDRELGRMATCLGLRLDAAALDDYQSNFLEDGLRHTVYQLNDLELDRTCPPLAREIYAALLDVASDRVPLDAAAIQTRVAAWMREFERLQPCLALADKLDEKSAVQSVSIRGLDKRIEDLLAAAAERDAHISNLGHFIGERDARIAELHQWVAARDGQIGALNHAIAEGHKHIAALGQAAVEREGKIAALHGEIATRDARISALDHAVAARDAAFNDALAARDAHAAALNDAIAARDAQIGALHGVVAARDHAIASLHASTSWRVTLPLRIVSRQIQRLRRVAALTLPAIRHGGGLRSTIGKAFRLYRREGLAGIKRGFRVVATADQVAPTPDPGVFDRNDYAEWVRRYDTLTDETRAAMRDDVSRFADKPLISVLMPTYNPKPEWLVEAIESVRQQIYPYWELCIADDASPDATIHSILNRYAKEDARIKVTFRERNGHISAASNSALELASGQWIALLDHDDLLSEHALFWVADAINRNPDVRLIYSDEDKIRESGERCDPYFKCDWNPDLFLSYNLFSHLGVYDAKLLRSIGGFRQGFEGSQDYDIALRCSERIRPDQIAHVPRVLYHWRIHAQSTASAGDAKPYALLAGKKALQEHLDRRGIEASVEEQPEGFYRIRYELPRNPPKVTLIIPTRNGLELIRQCVDSIFGKTEYPDYQILIVDNGSDDPATLAYLDGLRADPRVSIQRDDGPFNYSRLNNRAAKHATGEIIGLINNDIEVVSPDWLAEMVAIALQPGVGAVGAKLWYPDDTLQHAGVILGLGGVAGHTYSRMPKTAPGYFGRARVLQSLSAVTAACLVVRKAIFEEVGGLDETNLAIAFNDIDFCLRVRSAGYRNVWTPYAELYHHESATRGYEDTPEKMQRFMSEVHFMQERWGGLLMSDPAYSPNLTLMHADSSYAWPPRTTQVREAA